MSYPTDKDFYHVTCKLPSDPSSWNLSPADIVEVDFASSNGSGHIVMNDVTINMNMPGMLIIRAYLFDQKSTLVELRFRRRALDRKQPDKLTESWDVRFIEGYVTHAEESDDSPQDRRLLIYRWVTFVWLGIATVLYVFGVEQFTWLLVQFWITGFVLALPHVMAWISNSTSPYVWKYTFFSRFGASLMIFPWVLMLFLSLTGQNLG